MKKLLLVLAGVLLLFSSGEVSAKAFKLGRDVSTVSSTKGSRDKGKNETTCPANCTSCSSGKRACTTCKKGYYLKNGECITCPANATCDGGTTISCKKGYYLANSKACKACPANATCNGGTASFTCNTSYRKSDSTCVANCSGVSCKSGYRAESTDKGCCCVANCSGVSCKSGYTPAATSTGCCCTATAPVSCNTGYRLSGSTCVPNCSGVSCKDGYETQSSSTGCCCVAKAISNCATQSGTSCTKCNSGYYLSGGKCVSCPANATCVGTGTISCKTGYTLSGTSCIPTSLCPAGKVYNPVIEKCVAEICPINCADCSKGYCSKCENGYTLSTDGLCQLSGSTGPILNSRCPNTSLTYVAGRGCCTAAALADPQQQCFQEATATMLAN